MITVVLPAYNEEENLMRIPKELIPELKKLDEGYEILIVNDGSSDNTPRIAESLAERYREIRVVHHERNRGLGQAVRTGISHARGELLITMDSDFTFSPKDISILFGKYKEGKYDFVVGSPSKFGYNGKIGVYRKLLSKGCNLIYSVLLWKRITSVSPIFRLYQTKDLKGLRLKTTGFDINAEILINLIKEKKRFAEVPTQLTKRKFGESKINNLKEIKNHLCLFVQIIISKFG